MILLYDLVLLLFFIPTVAFLLFRYRRRLRTEVFFGWREKIGAGKTFPGALSSKPVLWIHCASLGEVRAVEPMLGEFPEYALVLSVLTYSGYEYARKNLLPALAFFAPLDFSLLTDAVASRLGAKALVIVETELWPALIHSAHKNNARIFIINARLSSRSFPLYRWSRFFWKDVLRKIDGIAARSEEDAERFRALGYGDERITVTGNIKYDRHFAAVGFARAELGYDRSDFIVVAGSTREGEEKILLESWRSLKKRYPRVKLIIAPRHLKRIPEIVREIEKRNVPVALRSKKPRAPECLLVDTFGELQKLYALCDVAFVGGSLVNKGGQNPIEPAAYAKPVLFGPYMDNFLSEARSIEKHGGGFMVRDPEELEAKLGSFISGESDKDEAGRRAYASLESEKGALQRTLEVLKRGLAHSTQGPVERRQELTYGPARNSIDGSGKA